MRDLIFLIVVAAMFAGGYFVMDRLDRVLEKLRPEEGLSGEEPDVEIFQPSQVENRRVQCYNSAWKDHDGDSARRPRRREERTWNRQGGPQTGFHRPFGLTAGHRGG